MASDSKKNVTSAIRPAEIRAARKAIYKSGLTSADVKPNLLAATSKQMGKGFLELLKLIAQIKMGGQGVGQSPLAKEYDQS